MVTVEHPEGMKQVLPNALKVCSVTALSLGTLQNPYLTVTIYVLKLFEETVLFIPKSVKC